MSYVIMDASRRFDQRLSKVVSKYMFLLRFVQISIPTSQ